MYNFDELVDRSGTYSLKWDMVPGSLPMWVADMDFPAAPEIRKALSARLDNGVFGYTYIPDRWNEAYMDWWKRRHGLDIEKDSLIFCTGVIPAISSCVRKLSTPAENVLLITPVYNIFYNSVLNNGRNVIELPMKYSGGSYHLDMDELREKLSDPQTSLMILCNPHNPMGIIWDRDTLSLIGGMCKEYNVTVISDEIHCDLTDPGREYVPFAAASDVCADISVTCIAPTKAFNIAGLNTAAAMVPNPHLRHKVWRALNTDEVAEPGSFAIDAAIAAFTEGERWLDEVREYIYDNKQLVRDFVDKEIPGINVVPSEATYLLWIDCSGICDDSKRLAAYIRKNTGLYLSHGKQYGKGGETFLRMNVACPRNLVRDGLGRLKTAIGSWRNE